MSCVTLEGFAFGLMDTAYDRNGQLPVVHRAILDRLSAADKALLDGSEELLVSNGWIERAAGGVTVLTVEGRAEVERRRQNNPSAN